MDTALLVRNRMIGHPVDQLARERLEGLFDAHHERLFALALRLTGRRNEALDLVQETFARATRRITSIPPAEPGARAWLTRVLINLVRDQWRRRRVRRLYSASGDRQPGAGNTTVPEEVLAVREALATLAPRPRAIVVLADIDGYTGPEIAAMLGMRAVTVRWHLAAARKSLRRILAPFLGGHDERAT